MFMSQSGGMCRPNLAHGIFNLTVIVIATKDILEHALLQEQQRKLLGGQIIFCLV
jgi:hypothetical protein